ncbi:cytochrome Cbb3 oxidase maturation protein CcoH [Dyadobacter beijingensis]|uniref:Cytochrome Cbb3 oxidase maturation protein CcoH n=1 Tax=Dyadobacter beijingensis TaxID=365489 RepID=A0ABQ2HJ07_9BACT|nr:FixH family protein [Dyadobacter beijingensis]GGM83323.1 cytochrome Cbb3 oxidase maturation protein CcoH [Dyadobacter beijingensis]
MKINWKALIAAVYMSFVSMILLLVSMSAGQKIDLASADYYEEELQFQGKIDKTQRAAALTEPISWNVAEHHLEIHYPSVFSDSAISGKISLYCPSDDRNDRQFVVRAQNHGQALALTEIPAGRYKIQVDWRAGAQTYWNEGVVVIGR